MESGSGLSIELKTRIVKAFGTDGSYNNLECYYWRFSECTNNNFGIQYRSGWHFPARWWSCLIFPGWDRGSSCWSAWQGLTFLICRGQNCGWLCSTWFLPFCLPQGHKRLCRLDIWWLWSAVVFWNRFYYYGEGSDLFGQVKGSANAYSPLYLVALQLYSGLNSVNTAISIVFRSIIMIASNLFGIVFWWGME